MVSTVNIDTATAAANTASRLRRSCDRAEANGTRFTRQALKAPDAHIVSTTYRIGERVTNGGNIYSCAVAGTTGGASPPTGTGYALITDGTVSWAYVGPTFSDDASAPSISVANTASSLGRFYRNAAGTFSSGAATVISNDSWYEAWGGVGSIVSSSGFGSASPQYLGGLAFMTDATDICIVKNAASGDFNMQVEIDGRLLTDGVMALGFTSGQSYHTLAFGSKKTRRIVVRWSLFGTTQVRGVYCNATATIWKPPTGLTGFMVGDSYLLTNREGVDGLISHYAFADLGIDNFYTDASAGSGFANGTAYTDTTRLGYITTCNPDVVIAQGSVNDASGSVAAGFASWYASVRAALGNKPWIFVTGVMGRNTSETAAEAALRVAVAAVSDPLGRLVFIPASGDAAGSWATGTGRESAPSGVGNGDVYWSSDNVHPLARGQAYLGRRIGQALRTAIRTR